MGNMLVILDIMPPF